MAPQPAWTRRTFVQALGSASVLGGVGALAPWASATGRLDASPAPTRFAYVSSADNAIHVFSIASDGSWTHVQTVASASPAALAMSPNQRFLYVANAIDLFQHRPAGSVEAYTVDAQNGSLTLVNRESLALSATMPKHLAVSPDGKQLAVAAVGGAAYNLLPLREDGSIGGITASLKQIGAGPDLDHQVGGMPRSVHFHSDGVLLGTDMGSDRLSSFSVEGNGAMRENVRHSAEPGSGPAHMVAHPRGKLYFTAGALKPVISSVQYVTAGDPLFQTVQRFQPAGTSGGITSLAIHVSGSLLFAAHALGISLVRTDASGALQRGADSIGYVSSLSALATSSDGAHLFSLNDATGEVIRFDVDLDRARLSRPMELARMVAPRALILKDR